MPASIEFFSARDLCNRWSVSLPTLWRRIQAFPDFPKPVTFATTRRYFRRIEIETFERAHGMGAAP